MAATPHNETPWVRNGANTDIACDSDGFGPLMSQAMLINACHFIELWFPETGIDWSQD